MNKAKRNEPVRKKSPLWYYLTLLIIPVLFFTLLELGLRIFNYGRNDQQWITVAEYKQMLNPDIAGRYFFNTKNFPQSNNEAFDIVKNKNAFRVFVLGGSSAAGFPYSPNGTFSRYIRDRLELEYPNVKIEVINAAITATNTFTIRDLLPGIIDQKPDLIIIYAGHNEYYGALGIGSMENIGESVDLVRFVIWLNKFKTVELVRNIFKSVSNLFSSEESTKEQQGGTLMARIVKDQLIELNSDAYFTGISQFEENLSDIMRLTEEAKIPLIIGTLVSNLKDRPPFVSVENSTGQSANVIFEKAKQRLAIKDISAADSLFRFAKDLDALRFRAPEKFNSIIKILAKKFDCLIVDIDSIFNAASYDGIAGNEFLVDHLHPSLKGYFLMGRMFYNAMQSNNLLPAGEIANYADPDSIVISNFAFSKLDSLIADIRLTGLLNDWPFVDNPDFSFIKKLKLDDRIDTLAYNTAVENMNWESGHRQAGAWYLGRKDYKNFAAEMNVLSSQYPFNLTIYDQASRELLNAKEYQLSLSFLLRRNKEKPDAFSSKWIGNILLSNGNVDQAIKYLKESNKFDASDAQVLYNLAGAYIQKKNYKTALEYFERCLEINPLYPNAQLLKNQLIKISQ